MITQTKTTWRKVKLGEVADVRWGDTNTTKAAYRPSGYLAFSATGPDGFMEHYDFDRDGVVLSAIGANCGETWFTHGRWSAIKNTIVLWGKSGKSDTKFLFYKTHNKRLWPVRGSAQPFISQGDAREMELFIPENPADQKRIADILSAFDDKIELNNKISKNLEATAQAIFKEWFVKNSKFKIQNAKLWEVKNVMEIVKRIPVGKKYENKTALLVGKVPILDQGQSGYIGYHNDKPGVVASIDEPVVVFTNHTCNYRLMTRPFSAIQNVLPYIGMNGYPTLFVYYLTRGKITMQEYKGHWPEFEQQEFLVPPPALTEEFVSFVKPIVQKMVEVENENQKLAALRDLLLPKLMSGEIRV